MRYSPATRAEAILTRLVTKKDSLYLVEQILMANPEDVAYWILVQKFIKEA